MIGKFSSLVFGSWKRYLATIVGGSVIAGVTFTMMRVMGKDFYDYVILFSIPTIVLSFLGLAIFLAALVHVFKADNKFKTALKVIFLQFPLFIIFTALNFGNVATIVFEHDLHAKKARKSKEYKLKQQEKALEELAKEQKAYKEISESIAKKDFVILDYDLSSFIKRYPESKHIPQVTMWYQEWIEEKDSRLDTSDMEKYISTLPKTKLAEKLRIQLDDKFFSATETNDKEEQLKAVIQYLKKLPAGNRAQELEQEFGPLVRVEENLLIHQARNGNAFATDPVKSAERYLKKYPDGKFARKAQTIIDLSSQAEPPFELLDNGTFKDPRFNITWQRCAVGMTWNGSTCVGKAKLFTSKEINSLYTNQNDWHVPESFLSLNYCPNNKKYIWTNSKCDGRNRAKVSFTSSGLNLSASVGTQTDWNYFFPNNPFFSNNEKHDVYYSLKENIFIGSGDPDEKYYVVLKKNIEI